MSVKLNRNQATRFLVSLLQYVIWFVVANWFCIFTHINLTAFCPGLPGWAGTRNTHTRLTTLCPGLPGWAGTRKVKPIWILLKQEAVSGSGIGWAIGKSAPRSRQITTPAPHHSVSYRPDALPAAQPTASKHWRHWFCIYFMYNDIYVMISMLLWMYYRSSAELTARFFF